MKNTILKSITIFVLLFSLIVFAQDKSKKNGNAAIITNPAVLQPIKQGTIPLVNEKVVPDFQVFEFPGFSGRFENPRIRDGKLVASFPLKNVSIKIPVGKIVFIKYCNSEFPSEMAYFDLEGSNGINLERACGVRSETATNITIRFNGISTLIEDEGDCKKVFGKISITVQNFSPTESDLFAFSRCSTGSAFVGENVNTYKPMDIASANSTRNISNYVFNDRPRLQDLSRNLIASSSTGENIATFVVGLDSYRAGRVKVSVNSYVAGAHKSCSTCDGYSSNIHMARAIIENFPLNVSFPWQGASRWLSSREQKSIILGPYRASGVPDGSSITAQGGFSKNFHVHLSFDFPTL
jgi:hypothetical protein